MAITITISDDGTWATNPDLTDTMSVGTQLEVERVVSMLVAARVQEVELAEQVLQETEAEVVTEGGE